MGTETPKLCIKLVNSSKYKMHFPFLYELFNDMTEQMFPDSNFSKTSQGQNPSQFGYLMEYLEDYQV